MKALLTALLLVQIVTPVFASDANSEITPETILARMNAYRAEQGLPPLRFDERLVRAARDRMRHMEEVGYWSHEAPDGMSPFVWVTARDYDFEHVAENLASGFETVGVLVSSWMESRGHRENIMSPDLQDCGIAIIEGSTTGRATGKSIVVLFGAQHQYLRAEKTNRR